jgi:hypothetical protein
MEEPRISKTTGILMLIVAVFFDLLNAGVNLIPVAGQIMAELITVFAYCCLWFWFSLKGVSLVSKKRAFRFFGVSIIELIPILNVLPGITLSVLLTIAQVQLEDRTLLAQQNADQKDQEMQELENSVFEKEQEEFEEEVDNTPPQTEPYEGTQARDTLEG